MGSYGINESTYNSDNLVSGGEIKTIGIKIESGEGELERGTVLGKVTKEVGSVADTENAGNGSLTIDLLKESVKGDYKVIMQGATAYKVYNPEGAELSENQALDITVVVGTIPLEAGDFFIVTVHAPSEVFYKKAVIPDTNFDGSEIANVILGKDVDATVEDITTWAYTEAEVDLSSMIIDSSLNVTEVIEQLRIKGIFVKESLKGD